MAVTNQELFNIFLANPNMSDAQIVSLMEQRGISPSQVSQTFGIPEGQVASRVAATVPNGQTVQLGDTIVQPVYQVSGSGEDQQIGAIENVITYKADENKTGGAYTQYTPTGEVERTGTQQEVKSGLKEFALGAGLLLGLPTLLNAGAGAVGATAAGAEAATAFELANAGIAGGAASFTPAQLALIEAGASAAEVAAAGGGLLTGGADVTTNTARELARNFELQNAGASALTDLSATTQAGLLTGGKTAAELAAEKLATDTATKTVVTKTAAELAADKLASDAALKVAAGVGTNLLTKVGSDAVSGLLQTTGSLVQSQESKDAAVKAAADITAATKAGVEASQFRPVGMTTRFGTSNYTYDPVTGRMTSAGYQLSPEAKNAQDRLVALAGRGLTQAEAAQQQFAPLQTGAQNLFGLGNQYISQSPQDVAQNYINQQMQLLQPSREMELANLQNRLQQQGRAGLSVAQGGSLGATTPELQALYNARAQQELQLAASAQQAGQQNVLFGAGLLGQGATAMGNYYGGQQAAYSPYTTALGQVQALEGAAQQPLQMGANLAQQTSAAGARSGMLGLEGQRYASAFNTGANATYNPYAAVMSAAGNPNSMFGQAFSSLFSPTVPPVTAMSAPATSYGAGNYYGNQDVLGVWGT
jgi:hypothetical protein